jgi:hypothetical protein
MARSKTSAATARKLAHQEQALALRRAGHSFERIGRKIGISTSRAHALVQIGLATARDQITASVDELRTEELSRLDGMLAKLYPKAEKGDIYAADRVLKIGERRARLLGLDAPVRTALEGGGEGTPPVSHVAAVTFYMPDNGRG